LRGKDFGANPYIIRILTIFFISPLSMTSTGKEREAKIGQYSNPAYRESWEDPIRSTFSTKTVLIAVHRGTVTYSARLQSGVHAIPATSLWLNSLWSVETEWTHRYPLLVASECGLLIPHNPQPTPGLAKVLLFNDFCFRPREGRAHRQTGWHSQDRPEHA
jgi:hypothetical protein